MATELSGLRIGLLTTSASRLGGGVYEAVVHQAELIRMRGGEARVFALKDEFSRTDAERFAGAKVQWSRVRGPAQIGYAPDLVSRLTAANIDCLHLHGIWMYPSRAATSWSRKTGLPLLISPHGMLDPVTLARGRWKKWLARHGYEYANWGTAHAFHALTDAEALNIRAAAGPVPCLVIPNAAPAPARAPCLSRAPLILFIGRIHAVKNVAGLLAGWQLAKLPADARLIIAGWGEAADLAWLEKAVAQIGPSVAYIGPVYGAQKQLLLNQARFTVLPSFSEAFPIAVLEGWAAGAPTILSRESNLSEAFAAGAAIECGVTDKTIAAAFEQALNLSDAGWLAMAQAGRDLATTRFSSEVISQTWADAYQTIVAGTDRLPQVPVANVNMIRI